MAKNRIIIEVSSDMTFPDVSSLAPTGKRMVLDLTEVYISAVNANLVGAAGDFVEVKLRAGTADLSIDPNQSSPPDPE